MSYIYTDITLLMYVGQNVLKWILLSLNGNTTKPMIDEQKTQAKSWIVEWETASVVKYAAHIVWETFCHRYRVYYYEHFHRDEPFEVLRGKRLLSERLYFPCTASRSYKFRKDSRFPGKSSLPIDQWMNIPRYNITDAT